MELRRTRSYDDLIARRYGRPLQKTERGARTIEELLASYYGAPAHKRHHHEHRHHVKPELSLSLSFDNGEVLEQAPFETPTTEEYVVERSLDDSDFEEYVVWSSAESMPAVSVHQEYGVDVRAPLDGPDAPPLPEPPPMQEPPRLPEPPPLPELPLMPGANAEPDDAYATAEEFMADIKSIIGGQQVYDAGSKKLVDRDAAPRGQTQSVPAEPPAASEPDKDAHDIFRRIAQSMQYANAYDLGNIDIEKRFDGFDRATDAATQPTPRAKQPQRPLVPARPDEIEFDTADFMEDLTAIHGSAAESPPSGD